METLLGYCRQSPAVLGQRKQGAAHLGPHLGPPGHGATGAPPHWDIPSLATLPTVCGASSSHVFEPCDQFMKVRRATAVENRGQRERY